MVIVRWGTITAWSCWVTVGAFILPSSRGLKPRAWSPQTSRASTARSASESVAGSSASAEDSKRPSMHEVQEGAGGCGERTDSSKFNEDGLSVSCSLWGEVDGNEVYRIDLGTPDGFGASFTTYGATLLSVLAGDKEGNVEEVTLQHDTLDGVRRGNAYYGATVGRVCNRIGGASFTVGGEQFALAKNEGPNCLHSGLEAFDKVLWRYETFEESDRVGVHFFYDSPDGDEGFPGHVAAKATYSVKRGRAPGTGELHTELEAKLKVGDGTRSTPSPINLTNHAYWNLSGSLKESVKGHDLMLACDRYLPLDDTQVPTGELAPVRGTFFDFSNGRPLGEAIAGVGGDPPGLDNCLVMTSTSSDGKTKASKPDDLPLMARLSEPLSGRVMEVYGSQPSIQVYTANYLSTDSADAPHLQHNAVCLETQQFPNAVNQEAWRDSVLLQPGATYLENARHIFSVAV